MRSIAIILSLAAAAIAQPTAPLYINAGGPSFASYNGNVWRSDASTITWTEWGLSPNPTVVLSGSTSAVSTTTAIAGEGVDSAMWRTARQGTATYSFSNLPTGTYSFAFYFAEFPASDGGVTASNSRQEYAYAATYDVGGSGLGLWSLLSFYDTYAFVGGLTANTVRRELPTSEQKTTYCETSGTFRIHLGDRKGSGTSRLNGLKVTYLGSYGCSGTSLTQSGSTPITISAPGNYYLADGVGTTDASSIVFASNGINLDCRGRFIYTNITRGNPRPDQHAYAGIEMVRSENSSATNCFVTLLSDIGANDNFMENGIDVRKAKNVYLANNIVSRGSISTRDMTETASEEYGEAHGGVYINNTVDGGWLAVDGANVLIRGNYVKPWLNNNSVSAAPTATCTSIVKGGGNPAGCRFVHAAIYDRGLTSDGWTVIGNGTDGSYSGASFVENGISMLNKGTGATIAYNVLTNQWDFGIEAGRSQKNFTISNNTILDYGRSGVAFSYWSPTLEGLRLIGNYFSPKFNNSYMYSPTMLSIFGISDPSVDSTRLPYFTNNLVAKNTYAPYGDSSNEFVYAAPIELYIVPPPTQGQCPYASCDFIRFAGNNLRAFTAPTGRDVINRSNVPITDEGGNYCYAMVWYVPPGNVDLGNQLKCGPTVTVFTNSPLNLTAGTPYALAFIAEGAQTGFGLDKYSFSVLGGLPTGMSMAQSGSLDRVLVSGTPTIPGTYTITVVASLNGSLTTGTSQFTITVQ